VKDDVDDQVRIFSAQALGRTKTPEGIRALLDAMSDKNAAVVRYAHNSLVAATREDFGFDTKAWLAWYQKTYIAPASSAPATAPQTR
jgi:HEAT repeat protein